MTAAFSPTVNSERYELSHHQKRIWVLNSTNEQYCCFGLTRLTGDVDVARLEQSLALLSDANEVMRTWFERPLGAKFPYQRVAREWSVKLNVSEAQQEDTLESELFAHWAAFSTDCLTQPGSNCHLYSCGNGVNYLVLALPMLCIDRNGLKALTEQLLALYHYGVEPDDEALQYLDVVEELDEQLKAPEVQALHETIRHGETFGNRRGRITLTETSAANQTGEKSRTKISPHRVACHRLVVAHSENLAAFNRDRNWHSRSVVFSLWQILLNRMSREPVPIGVLFDGRTDPELAQLPGLLSRVIPTGFGAGDEQTLSSFVALVEQKLSELERLQEFFDWQAEVDEQQPILVRYGFSYAEFENRHWCLIGGATEPFELSLNCTVRQAELLLDFEYNPAFFNEQTVSLLANRFNTMLTQALLGMTQNRGFQVAELNDIGPAQRQLLNDSFSPALSQASEAAHCVFEHWASVQPQSIALETELATFSYGQISQQSTALAAHLQSLGIGPGVPVAVCTERDQYLVISMLAILKLGAIYVPLDAQLAAQRISYIVADTGCTRILSVSHLSEQIADLGGAVMLDELPLGNDSFIPPEVSPDQLAYLIYTSGSTGQPKGVGISHSALVHYVTGVETRLKLSSDASMLSLASVATDLGHTTFFGALLTGRTLRLLSADKAMDADALADQLRANPVSCLKVVPSHLGALLTTQEPAAVLPTETLVMGGEAPTQNLIAQIRSLKPELRIVNHYGPTETTVGILTHEVTEHDSVCPIGLPLAGARAYVVNNRTELAGVGEVGELYLGGVALSQGYWQRPELTEQRFVPDNFSPQNHLSQQSKQRLYRSGDLAYYRADGNLIYMGRSDDQVKIRGFRVELGEVEKVLCQHPDVAQAVALLQVSKAQNEENKENSHTHYDLVAHLVMTAQQVPDVEAIQEFMHQQLPNYMVPVVMQAIRTLPLTQGGKVDRKALPRVERMGASNTAYVAPRNKLEQVLTTLWQELLSVPQVGIHDEFFALGGHSLLVTRYLSYVRKKHHLELSVKSFFDAPTVALQAEMISKLREAQLTKFAEIVAHDAACLSTLPLSYGQERLWFTQQMNNTQNGLYNTPHIWRIAGPLNTDRLSNAFNQIVERHQILRTGYQMKDGKLTQRIDPFSPQSIPVHDWSDQFDSLDDALSEGSALVAEIFRRVNQNFSLSDKRLFTIDLFCIAPQQHVLLYNLHHIVSDGWSLGIFQRELSAFYQAGEDRDAVDVAPLSYQYIDYAIWQRDMYAQGKLDAQIQYWRANLSGLPELRFPPVGNEAIGEQGQEQSGSYKFTFDKAMTQSLHTVAQNHDMTRFMLNLALVKLVVGHYCGQRDFAVGTSIAGRNREEFDSLIGFFVNQLVLRNDARPEMALTEFLADVKQTTLGAYEHQDVPFSLLVSELDLDRQAGQQPLFNCLFVFQEFPEQPLVMDGLTIDSWATGDYEAKFALTLYMGYEEGLLSGTWVYNKQWISEKAVVKLSTYYQRVAAQLVADSTLALEQLTYATEQELADEAEARRKSKMQKFSRVKRR